MARIHVCPLAHVERTLAVSGAASVISLLALRHRLPALPSVPAHRRLHVAISDIVERQDDHLLAESGHVTDLLRFVHDWDRRAPLLIHCYAGVSRSTAAAFVAACALDPDRTEADHAWMLRRAAPTATPNTRLVALADAILKRDGRMISAAAEIGRGEECYEGVCFALDVPDLVGTGARPLGMG